MQIFENMILLISIIFLVYLTVKRTIRKQYISIFLTISILLFTVHLFIEQTRWQILPLYLGFSITVTMVGLETKGIKYNVILRKVASVIISVLLFVSIISKIIFPIYAMPTPSGDLLIGTESFIITDENREEIYGAEGLRKIKVQIWYPASSTEDYNLVPWLEDGRVVAQALAKDMGLPSFVINHTELVLSNSYEKAPISEEFDSYPVVVISHGWRGFRNLHTDLAEELASLGYVVISIDHTYGSVATVFSDEEIAYLNLDALPETETSEEFLEYANTLVYTYAADITLALDTLEKMNVGTVDSIFEGKLDLTKIGLLGHSTGGGADVAVALNDERIKAIIGMDAWVEPIYESEIDKGLDIPALFLRSSSWETGENNNNLYKLVDPLDETSWLYQIDGTTHYDYSMVYMYSPLTKYINITGEVEGERLVTILKDVIVEFFDTNLKGEGTKDIDQLDLDWNEMRRIR